MHYNNENLYINSDFESDSDDDLVYDSDSECKCDTSIEMYDGDNNNIYTQHKDVTKKYLPTFLEDFKILIENTKQINISNSFRHCGYMKIISIYKTCHDYNSKKYIIEIKCDCGYKSILLVDWDKYRSVYERIIVYSSSYRKIICR